MTPSVHPRLDRSLRVAAVVALGMSPTAAWSASPWTSGFGHGYAQLGFSFFADYDAVAGPDGTEIALPRTLTNHTVQGYLQAGIGERTDVVVNVPVKVLATGEATGDEPALQSGRLEELGDVGVGVRQGWLARGPWVAAFQLDATLPTGAYDPATGLRTGYGSFSLRPALAGGRSFRNAYAFVHAGLTWRPPMGESYDTTLSAGLEGGAHLFSRLWLALVIDAVRSLDDGSHVDRIGVDNAGIFLDGEEYLVAGGKLRLGLVRPVGLELGAYKTLWSVYTPKAFGLNLGLSADW